MTDADLDELERLARKATPGPWKDSPKKEVSVGSCDECGMDTYVCRASVGAPIDGFAGASLVICTMSYANRGESDAAYIAAAHPQAVLALIARLRAAEAEVGRLRGQIEGHCERIAKQSDLLSKRAEK